MHYLVYIRYLCVNPEKGILIVFLDFVARKESSISVPVMYGFFTLTSLASKSGVMTPSSVPNMLPKPSVINIMKNKIAQT